jgi:molecular chaperone HtpG
MFPVSPEDCAMTTNAERYDFQTEAKQMLDLMIHSVYSHKEIFLRELISNASDALDKLRYEALQNAEWADYAADPHIRIEIDAENRTLSISDNGIGMNRDEVVKFLGTIARSGTREYLRLLREGQAKGEAPELIGQFGVGFYSSFMVADEVTLVTRRAGDAQAWRWNSSGDGTYTIEEGERETPGTTVTLHLKLADDEQGTEDYAKEWEVRNVVRKYSDFVSYPIRMRVERKEIERDDEGMPKEGAEEKTVVKDETLNSMQAIWMRPESETTEEEYAEFYKHISHDWTPPLARIRYRAEGTHEFRSLLFIPERAPFDFFTPESERGIHLYIKRIFIMQDCEELIPNYLRFVRGVVDSESLSLNISREILQKNHEIQVIRKSVTRKVLDKLGELLRDDREKYENFWKVFGRVLKEGLLQDTANRDRLLDLCLVRTTKSEGKLCSFADVKSRLAEGQDTIYTITGTSPEAVAASPHLEAFREKGIEVVFLTDPVDAVWIETVGEYQGLKFLSAGKGEVELETGDKADEVKAEREEQEKRFDALMKALAAQLEADVKEVRLSSRLTTSPACLVGDTYDPSPLLEQILKASGQERPKTKRILEINPKHPLIEKLRAIHEQSADDPRLADYAALLHGQATLAEGGQIADPSAFGERLARFMTEAN